MGIALRLKLDSLETIQVSDHNPRDCLRSMVIEWLKRNYNVRKFGEPTWQKLVQAVGHPAGGANMALAREIARRHRAGGMLKCLCFLSSTRVLHMHVYGNQSDNILPSLF